MSRHNPRHRMPVPLISADERLRLSTMGSSDSKAAEAPAGNPADAGANPAPSTNHTEDPDPMPNISFASVTLHKAMPRLDAGIGQATQSTTFFLASTGLSIDLDTATGLVRLSKGSVRRYIPREGVEFFGPTLDDAIAESKARESELRRRAEANARAEAEAAEAAAQPA